MKCRFIRGLVAASCLVAASVRAELHWLTDYDAALKQARDEGKLVFIDFTGSDWCGWCIKLKSEVFDTREFEAFASANLVLLEVDFPRRKALSAKQAASNQALAGKFGVEGYPTVFIVGGDGKPVARGGYMAGGPTAFINAFKQAPGAKWKDPNAGVSAAPSAAPAPRPAPNPEEVWAGITSPPKRYDDLRLTGLSGPASRRLAIINNQTFAPGESARVKLKGGEVKLLCKEIRAKSVVVQLEGTSETRELFVNTN